MQSQTFQAREMKEALALVRRELGPDAVIVGSRKIPGRALGLLGGTLIEVTAQGTAHAGSGQKSDDLSRRHGDELVTANKHKALVALNRAKRLRSTGPPRTIRQSITRRPESALAAATGGNVGRIAPHAALRRRLLAALVPREQCESWLARLGPTKRASREQSELALRNLLLDEFGSRAPLLAPHSRVVALVGATGVGKTTSIAKLAAHATLVEGKRVALISLDDNRIGAISQLNAYAELLDLPLRACGSDDSLARALSQVNDAELVFVDTPGMAGVSHSASSSVHRLQSRLDRAGEDVSTHLCLPASTRQEELERLTHIFSALDVHALMMTKVDEAVAIGSLLGIRSALNLNFSYLTTGQQVPEDITPATAQVLTDLLLGGEYE